MNASSSANEAIKALNKAQDALSLTRNLIQKAKEFVQLTEKYFLALGQQ